MFRIFDQVLANDQQIQLDAISQEDIYRSVKDQVNIMKDHLRTEELRDAIDDIHEIHQLETTMKDQTGFAAQQLQEMLDETRNRLKSRFSKTVKIS